jgi:hypothetical protein
MYRAGGKNTSIPRKDISVFSRPTYVACIVVVPEK